MKKYIIILNNRELLEDVTNCIFDNTEDAILYFKKMGMTKKEEKDLGFYEISEFMDLVNDQILDNFTGTFIGYINIK